MYMAFVVDNGSMFIFRLEAIHEGASPIFGLKPGFEVSYHASEDPKCAQASFSLRFR